MTEGYISQRVYSGRRPTSMREVPITGESEDIQWTHEDLKFNEATSTEME